MRIGILDIDTKKEADRFGRKQKYPNIACGQIYGYWKQQDAEIIYPWREGIHVDRLYVSTIFITSRPMIQRRLPYWRQFAKKISIGGSGWDDYTKEPYDITELPLYMKHVDPKWTYELYDIDYGIGFTFRGCHVGCNFCNVPKKEGLVEYRVAKVSDIINPKSNHIVLMNNNSLANLEGFLEDIEEIKHYSLSVHWDQANDITLMTPQIAEALRSVNYRGFTGKHKQLYFAFDQMIKKKIEPDTGRTVKFDMMKTVREKVGMMKECGINPRHLTFYMLIGFDTEEWEDIARVDLLRELGCDIHPMLYVDIKGRGKVDGSGMPQRPHSSSIRDWVHSKLYRSQPLHQFTKYQKRMAKWENAERQMTLF